MSEPEKSIALSRKTIVFAVLFLVFLYVLKQISGIAILLFISFLLMTAIDPLVTKFEKWKIPRSISALVCLLTILSLFASGVVALIPPVVDQTESFFLKIPTLLGQLGIQLDQSLISSQLGSIPKDIFKVISAAFSNALAVFAILVISFYLTVERKQIFRQFTALFGNKSSEVEDLLQRVEVALGGWIRGELFLCTIIGVAVYIGLVSLSIPYAIPLAIIGGILEAVPNIGPTVSMIPAAIVGFTISPLHGGAVVLLYFLIQQLENNLIVPLVMKKAIDLNPVVTIVSLMIGLKLGGPVGAILAVPLVVVGRVVLPFLFSQTPKFL